MLLYIRPKILELNGLKPADFKDHAEALKCADDLIARNTADFGHDGAKEATH